MILNLPLTYGPKIGPVKAGECQQSIRKLNQERPKTLEDKLKFHTWAGTPYRSKWDWRSPLLDIEELLRIMYDPFKGWYWASLKECNNSGVFFHHAESKITDLQLIGLAQMDYIEPVESFTEVFLKMHPEMKYSCTGFEVLRWNPRPIGLTSSSPNNVKELKE
jgi:hypothetical protein